MKGANRMYNDEREWFSQQLMSYRDTRYNSNSTLYLEVSTSISNGNYSNISSPALSILIRSDADKRMRNCRMHCVQVADLFQSLQKTVDAGLTFTNPPTKISKSFRGMNLEFDFTKTTNGDEVTVISIIKNDSDFGRVIIPDSVMFPLFAGKIKDFVVNYNQYVQMMIQLVTNRILMKTLESNKLIESAIKTLPSNFISQESFSNEPQEPTKSVEIQQNFEDSLDIDNIRLEEVEKVNQEFNQPSAQKIESVFVEKVLNNDISVLEEMINSSIPTPSPVMTLFGMFSQELYGDTKLMTEFLPNITNEELRSTQYFSKLYFSCAMRNYAENSSPLPLSSPVIRYRVNKDDIDIDKLNMAYDLLTFVGYVRIMKNRLDEHISDAVKNKSVMYLGLRCFTDIFTLSLLENQDSEVILSSVVSRFSHFKEIGVFQKFEDTLESTNCNPITKSDIAHFVRELTSKVIGKDLPPIRDLHENGNKNGTLKLPSDNSFSLEQIINEIIRLEVMDRFGKDVSNPETRATVLGTEEVSDEEILGLFGEQKKKTKKKEPKDTSIARYLRNIWDDIPTDHRVWLKSILKKLETQPFDPNWIADMSDYHEFPEDVIKALYIWNPKEIKTYTEFCDLIKSTILTADEIIPIWMGNESEDKKSDESSDWANLM